MQKNCTLLYKVSCSAWLYSTVASSNINATVCIGHDHIHMQVLSACSQLFSMLADILLGYLNQVVISPNVPVLVRELPLILACSFIHLAAPMLSLAYIWATLLSNPVFVFPLPITQLMCVSAMHYIHADAIA